MISQLHRYEYLLSDLPSLDPIGSVPPLGKADLLEQVGSSNGPVRTVEIILLSDDLMQYQALLAKEIEPDRVDLAILSLDKEEGEPVLPAFLLADEAEGQTEAQKENSRLSVDGIWARYFRYAASAARRSASPFLTAWVEFEVGLRNALVVARCRNLELDPAGYMVAPELAGKDEDYSAVVSAWSSAANPQAALEVLDNARWDWIEEHEGWYSFSACEIEAYTAKLVLLHRWRRILSEKRQGDRADSVSA